MFAKRSSIQYLPSMFSLFRSGLAIYKCVHDARCSIGPSPMRLTLVSGSGGPRHYTFYFKPSGSP